MYHKIETLFNRDPSTFKVNPECGMRVPGFQAVDNWVVEEKCDGMNIQVHMNDPTCLVDREAPFPIEVLIQGRTPNAQFKPHWMEYLKSIFTAPLAEALFKSELHPGNKVTLFGELMGPKINGNLHGLTELEFRGFDVLVDDAWWMERAQLDQVLYHFKTKGAPVVGRLNTERIIHMIRERETVSQISTNGYFEGVVCRPAFELRLQSGERLIWKLKTKDFAR